MSQYVRQKKSQRKHPVVSSATSPLKGPAVPAAPKDRPGWKGPGFIRNNPKQHRPQAFLSSSTSVVPSIQKQTLSIELQQLLLNIFRTTFPVCQDYEALKPTLQEVNNALSIRDYEKAYSQPDWLEAYTVRWSPNRALCYASVLVELCEEFQQEACIQKLLGSAKYDIGKELDSNRSTAQALKVICYGGNAAEVMALAAILYHISTDTVGKLTTESFLSGTVVGSTASSPMSEGTTPAKALDVHLVDIANWASVISTLQTGLVTAPILSKYASTAAKAKNAPFLNPGALKTSFKQTNIFEASQEELAFTIGAEPAFVTLFFTLNDLRISSITKTATFLLKLTLAMPRNSLLLVIDTPDLQSKDIAQSSHRGGNKTMSSIHSLLDTVLMEKHIAKEINGKAAWKHLHRDRSRSYILEKKLKYPLSLENINFQVHLFRRQ